jgi:hypothetical protein
MMVTMMAVMGLGARGNNRNSQNNECNGSKKQRTQLHKIPSQAATLPSGLLVRRRVSRL